MKLSVIMPAYNERATIREIVSRVLAVDLGADVKMEFVLVRPGAFTMGEADNGIHKVTLTRPFYLGKYEVTQEQ